MEEIPPYPLVNRPGRCHSGVKRGSEFCYKEAVGGGCLETKVCTREFLRRESRSCEEPSVKHMTTAYLGTYALLRSS